MKDINGEKNPIEQLAEAVAKLLLRQVEFERSENKKIKSENNAKSEQRKKLKEES